MRDLTEPDPPYGGHGNRPKVPFRRVDRWAATVPTARWQTIDVRDGAKGPLVVQAAWTLVQARTEGRVSDVPETLVVFREEQADGTWKHDYLLSDAVLTTAVEEFARPRQVGQLLGVAGDRVAQVADLEEPASAGLIEQFFDQFVSRQAVRDRTGDQADLVEDHVDVRPQVVPGHRPG